MRQDGKRTGVSESLVHDQTAATPRTSSRDVGFTYDDAGRLTKEDGKDGLGVSYENAWQYDAAGNRTVTTYTRATKEAPNTVATTTTIAAVFSGNDWLKEQTSTVRTAAATNATTTFYGYDRNGAQTNERVGAAGSVEVNEWQFDGTLASTQTQGQATGGSEFVYDAGGNRLKQRTQIGKPEAKEVRYLVDPNTSYAQVVQERDENNVLQARYAWEDGLAPLVMWRRTDSGAYAAFFYLCDGQDSVRQLSDASGKVTDSYFYDAFGNALQGGSGDTPNSFRYTGQQLDASGDYYLRARYYNSGSGRFLSHDPMMGSSEDPISMHRYLYCRDQPLNSADPSGNMDISIGGLMSSLGNRSSMMAHGVRTTTQVLRQSITNFARKELLSPTRFWGAIVCATTEFIAQDIEARLRTDDKHEYYDTKWNMTGIFVAAAAGWVGDKNRYVPRWLMGAGINVARPWITYAIQTMAGENVKKPTLTASLVAVATGAAGSGAAGLIEDGFDTIAAPMVFRIGTKHASTIRSKIWDSFIMEYGQAPMGDLFGNILNSVFAGATNDPVEEVLMNITE